MGREETSKYTDVMADGTALQFTFEMGPSRSSLGRLAAIKFPRAASGRLPDSPGPDEEGWRGWRSQPMEAGPGERRSYRPQFFPRRTLALGFPGSETEARLYS